MTPFLKTLLSLHVILGVIGVIAFAGVWMNMLKRALPLKFLKWSSAIGFISFIASWFAGGYYYTVYYGKAAKPLIVKGQYPWAHALFMEAKEHIFLFLPFLAASLFIALLLLDKNAETEVPLKRALTWLAGVIVVLGIIMTLSGIIISGAVR
ncbi:MAG: hypothetical protein NUV61_04050 [Candidatus Azambacteria bacterium]|nr:hypothetical protein [Candidatus Azambacteria bacterium]